MEFSGKKGIPKEVVGQLRKDIKTQEEKFKGTQSMEDHFRGDLKIYKKPYIVYDDSFQGMPTTFKKVLGFEKFNTFEDYLRARFPKEKMGILIGVELGGPGSNFFGGFSSNLFARSMGITVRDLRQNYQTEPSKQRDINRHHSVVEADIFSRDALTKLDEWLRGQKADFIYERLLLGWETNVQNMVIFAKYFSRYYERLSKDGCMFVETPFNFPLQKVNSLEEQELVDKNADFQRYKIWRELLKKSYGHAIDIYADDYVMRIRKKEGSPDRIQVLKF